MTHILDGNSIATQLGKLLNLLYSFVSEIVHQLVDMNIENVMRETVK